MIVVDASAAVEILRNTPAGRTCLDRAIAGRPALVPGHFDAEVYGTLRRFYLQRQIDRSRLDALVDELGTFDAERVALAPLLPNVTQLIDVLGAHDAFYVLLAISRRCPLLTCDAGLARASARLGVDVVLIDRSLPA